MDSKENRLSASPTIEGRAGVGDVVQRGHDFGRALWALKEGRVASRAGWNGNGQRIELQRPDANSKMSLPYIYIVTVSGDKVPWLASQTDLLANDWFVL